MFHLIPSAKISGNHLNEDTEDEESLMFCDTYSISYYISSVIKKRRGSSSIGDFATC